MNSLKCLRSTHDTSLISKVPQLATRSKYTGCLIAIKFYDGMTTEITNDGRHVVTYDDNEVHTLNIPEESWRFILDDSIHGNTAELQLCSNEQLILNGMLSNVGKKPFMWRQAHAFRQHALKKAQKRAVNAYANSVKRVPRRSVSKDANIISSHVLYKIKVNVHFSLSSKALKAPHGNEEIIKADM